MSDTHNERGGDADPYDWDPVYAAATIAELQKQLAAATARAESATVLPERWRALIAERDEAVRQAQEAQARLGEARAQLVAELQPIRAEWSTNNTYSHPSDDVISQGLAGRRVATHPDIHTAVLRRQLYAGPWVPADQACRSCGETDRVAGDPPLCSNCAVYGPTYRGVACWPPIAAPDARSATETAEDGVQASGSELEFEGRSAGLCGATVYVDGEEEICARPPHGDDTNHAHDPFAGIEDDDTTEDNRG